MRRAPWLVFIPGMAVLLTTLAFNFVGDGVRAILDPRQHNGALAARPSLCLLRERGPRTVVFQGYQQQREIIRSRFSHVALCVGNLRPSIGEEHSEAVAGYDENGDVNLPVGESFSEVDDIDDDEITAR